MGWYPATQLMPDGLMTTPRLRDSNLDAVYQFASSNLTADRIVTLPLLTGAANFVFDSFLNVFTVTQTITQTAVGGGASALVITPGAHTAVIAEVNDLIMNSHTITVTGNFATQRFNYIATPTITSAGAQTVTTATTFEIQSAPQTAGAAILSALYAFNISGGALNIANAAGSSYRAIRTGAHTITLTTATQVTGTPSIAAAAFNIITINQSGGAVIVDMAATVYISGAPTPGAGVTLTTPLALFVDAGTVRFDGNLLVNAASTVATAGAIRLPNATSIGWINAAGLANLTFGVDAGDAFVFTGGSVAAFTMAGALNMANSIITNIGVAGTDFTASGGLTLADSLVITSIGAAALAVGRQGATNPVLQVNAATVNVVTGVLITGAAAAAGVAIAVTSSGANESLTFDALGTGTVTIGSISTGNVIVGSANNRFSVGGAAIAAQVKFSLTGSLTPTATDQYGFLSNMTLDTSNLANNLHGFSSQDTYGSGANAYTGIAFGVSVTAMVKGTSSTIDRAVGFASIIPTIANANYGLYISATGIDAPSTVASYAIYAVGRISLSTAATAGGVRTLVLTSGDHTAMVAENINLFVQGYILTVTGNFTTQRFAFFDGPVMTSVGAQTVTNAIALQINGAVPAGAITFTNSVILDLPTYVTNGTTASGLRVAAPSGAATNWAILVTAGNVSFAGTLLVTGIATYSNKIYPGTDAAATQSASGLYAGTGAPNNANGADGDIYFRSDGGALTTVYQRRAGAWVGVV